MWQCWQEVHSVVCALWIFRDLYGLLTQACAFALIPSPSLDLMILKGDGDSVFEADMHASGLNSLPPLSLLELIRIALGWLREFIASHLVCLFSEIGGSQDGVPGNNHSSPVQSSPVISDTHIFVNNALTTKHIKEKWKVHV